MLMDTIQFIQDSDWNYDIAGSTLSKPTDGAVLSRFRCTRAMKIPTNANGSTMSSEVATTGITTYLLKKNSVQFGTCAFSAAANASVFTVTETSFAIDDEFTVEAPATADATHDQISWTITTRYTT